jgi:hypothetical protein
VELIEKDNPQWIDLYIEMSKWYIDEIPAFAGMTNIVDIITK